MFAELNGLSVNRYVPSREKSLVHEGLGDDEAALGDLAKAYQEGSHRMFTCEAMPSWILCEAMPASKAFCVVSNCHK
jgi:hypothetical protein